jgi:hypothetical protein
MNRYKLGRLAPHDPATHPRIAFRDLLGGSYPTAPTTADYISGVESWPMYMNGPDPSNPPEVGEGLGDCTIAAPGHMEQSWTFYATGTAVAITNADVLKAYEAVGHYRLGDPSTDQGCNMQDVLTYWRKTGIGGHKILAFAEVDPKNVAEMEAALALFGNLYVGVNLPNNAESQFDAGQPWSVVADDGGNAGGHAICVGQYLANLRKGVTWGRAQEITAEWIAKYAEECWIVITAEWIEANGDNPEGVSMSLLGQAFTAITGEPDPFPVAPVPTPTPPPAPVAGPDAALVAALDPWAAEHHTGANATAARAFVAWREAKGL